MKNQATIYLVIAATLGLVAVVGINKYLAAKGEEGVVETANVLVAATPISPGARLTELNTKFVEMDVKSCPQGAITNMEEVAERGLKVARSPGDWITSDQLTAQGSLGAVSVIPTGMRVTTIPVDATTSHSGMLQPGNRIDLLLSYKWKDPDTRNQVQKVRPLLQYIEVFAVGDQVYGVNSGEGTNDKARNISLLVDTEQMMILKLAQDKGKISTVLRSNEDTEEITVAEVSEESLDGKSRGGINETSTVGAFDHLKEPEVEGFVMPEAIEPEQPAQSDMMGALSGMFAAVTEPAAEEQEETFWTMTIHERGSRRRERVNLMSEEPLYEPEPSRPMMGPPGSGPQPDTKARGAAPEDMGLDFGDSDLEETASGLLEMLDY